MQQPQIMVKYLLGMAMAGGFLLLRFIPNQPLPFLATFSFLFLLWSFSLWTMGVMPFSPRNQVSNPPFKDWIWILGFSLVFQILQVGSHPLLETDPYRYLWDGRQLSQGLNPYLLAPSEAHVSPEPWYKSEINHPNLKTIYPPVAELFFGLSALLKLDSLAMLQILCVLLNLGVLFGIAKLLDLLSMPRMNILWLAWNPLWIKEYINSAHVDILMMFFGVWSLYFLLKRNEGRSFALLTASALSKWSFLIFLPWWFFRSARRGYVGLFFLILIAAYFPFLSGGHWKAPFESLGIYSKDWYFNSFFFEGFFQILHHVFGFSVGLAVSGAQMIGTMLLLSALGFGLIGNPSPPDFVRRCFWLMALALLLSQTAFPWYIGWSLLFGPFMAGALTPWAWTGLAPLSYLYLVHNQDVTPVRLLAYLLLSIAILRDLRREPWWPVSKGITA